MDNEREKEVEDLEQKAKFTIITMECDDDENGRSKKILDDAAKQLQRLFQEMRDWLNEHADSMEVNERMERLKQDTQSFLRQHRIVCSDLRSVRMYRRAEKKLQLQRISLQAMCRKAYRRFAKTNMYAALFMLSRIRWIPFAMTSR